MYKLLRYVLVLCILLIYFVKSITSINSYANTYYSSIAQEDRLRYELEKINNEILQLEFKINGLSSNNINIDLLSYLSKLLLNYREVDSYIIYNNS